jgi:hypothetical protein
MAELGAVKVVGVKAVNRKMLVLRLVTSTVKNFKRRKKNGQVRSEMMCLEKVLSTGLMISCIQQ